MRPAEALTTCTKAAAGTRAHPVAALFLFNFAFQVVLVFHSKLHTMNPAEPSPEAAIGCQNGIGTMVTPKNLIHFMSTAPAPSSSSSAESTPA